MTLANAARVLPVPRKPDREELLPARRAAHAAVFAHDSILLQRNFNVNFFLKISQNSLKFYAGRKVYALAQHKNTAIKLIWSKRLWQVDGNLA